MLQVGIAKLPRRFQGRAGSMSNSNSPHDLEEADSAADVRGILIVFGMMVLGAVYFISGWAPGI
jgi:hypothetical protein